MLGAYSGVGGVICGFSRTRIRENKGGWTDLGFVIF